MIEQKKTVKQYKALVVQTGTNNPTTSTLRNTLNLPGWERIAAGVYTMTKTNAFPATRTFVTGFLNGGTSAQQIRIVKSSENVITMSTYDGGTLTDGLLSFANVYIEVWPQ